jgi:hypothetical protein
VPRALTIQRAVITAPERARYLNRLRARLEHYSARECRFWVFEEAALPGVFVEFTEANDAATLAAAHASSPEPPRDAARIYTQIEVS